MTQLILDVGGYNVSLPETKKKAYTAQTEDMCVEIKMISGRRVKEVRGSAWVVSYQYGYLDDETKNAVIAACEKGKKEPITCGFLTQESKGALTYSEFFVSSFTRPSFMWSRTTNGTVVPLWAGFSLELKEVSPHA